MIEPKSPSIVPPKRKWMYRVLALILGFVPFVLMEGICLFAGWGTVDDSEDQYVGFSAIQPLFEKSETEETCIISPARRKYFAHDEFPVQKPQKGFRIFCLGGSTVQGRPYSIESSFTRWLEISLQQMQPDTDWDVINCGGISYASYRLVPILKECLSYEPNLIIVCTGHNEFLEERQYGKLKQTPPALQQVELWGRNFRTVNALQSWMVKKPARAELDVEVQARLDFKRGLERFQRDPEWADAVTQHFESNLQRMIDLAKKANVPILFVKPCSNLAGTRPFKDEENASLSANQRVVVQELYGQAKNLITYDLTMARDAFEAICENDPGFASAWYELGLCEMMLKNYEASRKALVQARDTDVCPLRMTSALEAALDDVVQRNQILLLDAHQLLESKTETGILGDFWLVDHVHPSFSGHQEIGLALAKELEKLQIVTAKPGWEATVKVAFKDHFESLPRAYFHKGQRMLERLRGWTEGKAEGTEEPHIE